MERDNHREVIQAFTEALKALPAPEEDLVAFGFKKDGWRDRTFLVYIPRSVSPSETENWTFRHHPIIQELARGGWELTGWKTLNLTLDIQEVS